MEKSKIVDGKKLCSSCGEWLPVESFSLNRKAHTKLASWCKDCQKSAASKLSPRARRQKKIKSLYNLSWSEYEAMFKEQEGLCKICTKDLSVDVTDKEVETARVDHCHNSGEVRGLLCGNCNSALGLIGDSLENAERMVKYLHG